LIPDQHTEEEFLALFASRFARANFFQARTFIAGILPNGPTGAFSPLLCATPCIGERAYRGKHANGSDKS
jgi:hypothetical protein